MGRCLAGGSAAQDRTEERPEQHDDEHDETQEEAYGDDHREQPSP